MMGKRRIWFSVIVMWVFVQTTLAQELLSPARDKFVKEFAKYLSAYDAQLSRDLMKVLEPAVLNGTIPEDYFKRMVATCNLMDSKKMKPFPEVYNYVFSVYSFVVNKQPQSSYAAWHESVDKMLDSRNVSRFKDFIGACANFFSAGVLNETRNYQWKIRGGQYVFRFEKDGPVIDFTNAVLACYTINTDQRSNDDVPFKDSAVVYQTNGVFDILKDRWDGKGGKVNWVKVGLPENETFAMLSSYRISLKTTSYNCDTVTLTTPYFSKPIKGTLSERTMNFARDIDKVFPQFISFDKRLTIKNIMPDVDYEGGFALKGASFVGVGTQAEKASMIFYRQQRPFIRVSSQEVEIDDKMMIANNAMVHMSIGLKDSIFHPGANVSFFRERNTLELNRGKTGISMAPFIDSYHKLEIYVDRIIWDRKNPELVFKWGEGISQEQRLARFESLDYYNSQLYDRLSGTTGVHPLAAIYQYTYKYDETVLTEGKAATALSRTIEQAKPLLLELANYGFLSYDIEKGIVTVMPKLEQFVKAKAAKVDFDNIIFVSDMRPKSLEGYTREEIERDAFLKQMQEKYQKESQERKVMPHFGTMDLGSMDLNLRAIDRVTISDFQNTQVFPENEMVTVKQNRNFLFTGWVNVGRWEVNFKEGSYDYENNKLNVIESDMAFIRVRPFKEEDGKKPIRTFSSISGIKGEILVDNPKNRSGLRQAEYTDYPKLLSKSPTKVFYNDRKIQRGSYDSLRFFFTLDPFEFDSLDNFIEAAARFQGEMTSGGIFPKFREQLKVMPDYSLGFVQQAPKEGYDFYGTGSKYKNKIVLSNNGLQGSGEIEYETSLSISKAFTFMPDSTVGYAEFNNKPREEGIESPDIIGENVLVTYVPNGNVLKARSMQKPMKFFNGEASFNGVVFVRPSGVKGRGAFDFKSANLSSLNFNFTRWDIIADTSSFKLSDQQEGVHPDDALAFKTNNVQGRVSFKDRKGQFKSNHGEELVEFPINQYVCRMDMFNWFMDQDELELYKDAKSQIDIDTDLDLVGSNFFSINKDQDSLNFLAPKARFEMRTKSIFCDKVQYIDVADARIYPDSMKVTIRKKAKMDDLQNSRIVANYITKYHEIRNATTNITAKKAYTSKGEYPYYDLDSNLYMIQLDRVYLDSSFQTVAEGKVDVTRNFKLSPRFDFYGNVKLNASNPNLLFKGATRINHECESFAKNWMSFEARIDRLNIQIPVIEDMKSLEGKPIAAGVVWQFSDIIDSTEMYPTFLSELRSASDKKVLSSNGLIQFNKASNEFEIASTQKLLNRGEVGNYVALNVETCSMTGDGKINLGFDYGDASVEAVGTVDYNQAKQETSMNVSLKVNVPLDKAMFEKVAEGIKAMPDLKPLDMNPTTLEQAMATWSSVKVADKFKSDYTLRGEVKKMPDEFENSILITGIRLKSINKEDEFRGLVSSKIEGSLVSLYSEPVLKSLPVQVAFYRSATGNRFGINIEVPAGKMYFFNYELKKKDGVMQIYTSDKELEEKIAALKPDKKKVKNFEYDITSNPTYQSTFKRLLQ
jgi:hypothetical protein